MKFLAKGEAMCESENQDGKRVRVCALTDEEEMAHAFKKAGFNDGDLAAIVRIIKIFKEDYKILMSNDPEGRMKRAYRFVGAFYGWL